ncbi:MAG: DUF3343 domain-containing protein [Desulfuromonas sp.]|nr:DUF3343 domain-containing protein [Desulfuromonas sp.]
MLMIEQQHMIIIFNSLHRVMLAELRLQSSYPLTLMPVPRSLSADCGMVLRIDAPDYSGVVDQLTAEGLGPFSVYRLAGVDFELVGEFS